MTIRVVDGPPKTPSMSTLRSEPTAEDDARSDCAQSDFGVSDDGLEENEKKKQKKQEKWEKPTDQRWRWRYFIPSEDFPGRQDFGPPPEINIRDTIAGPDQPLGPYQLRDRSPPPRHRLDCLDCSNKKRGSTTELSPPSKQLENTAGPSTPSKQPGISESVPAPNTRPRESVAAGKRPEGTGEPPSSNIPPEIAAALSRLGKKPEIVTARSPPSRRAGASPNTRPRTSIAAAKRAVSTGELPPLSMKPEPASGFSPLIKNSEFTCEFRPSSTKFEFFKELPPKELSPKQKQPEEIQPEEIQTDEMKPERKPEDYAEPFCQFLTENPTVFHTVAAMADQLKNAGYEKLSERQEWKLKTGGKYYVERNGSSLIAFLVGEDYKPGNGAAIIAGHVDAVTVKVKPVSKVPTKAGYLQLGVAPYAGGLNSTWWDRDLGIGGRVIVQSEGKITTKLVTLNRGIARIPTLAPHFGAAANGPFNTETQMVPIIGLDDEPESDAMVDAFAEAPRTTSSCFADTQPPRLVKAVTGELGIKDPSTILDWDLELFDTQPAALGGLDKDLLFAPRIDDKICSWAAVQALLASHSSGSGIIRIAALFDNEEIGSLLRQGARGNFLPATLSRAVEALAPDAAQADLSARTAANSFLLSADVTHAANPNFLGAYLAGHAPRLNVGPAIARDPNGHMTSDGPSCALLSACVAKRGLPPLQVFQIRNDSRSGGTVGPMLSSAIGCRAIDAGIVQLSMHSIRATTGAKDPGLGVKVFEAFYGEFEKVDGEVVD